MIVAKEAVAPLVENNVVADLSHRSIVLYDVSWEMYQVVRASERNGHLRMIYDQGVLEIMSPLKRHGKIATLLGLMIYEWTRLRRIEIESGRDMTFAREDLAKGLEPDLCYWIANQPAVHGRDEIDLLTDPPPDLVLEVDISRSSIPKLPIYEALKIPEVWCWRKGLEVLHLDQAGHYARVTDSSALPGFPLKLAEEFIQRRNSMGEIALMEQFEKAIAALPKE
jgi:Uma2 family endonuclease